MRFAFATDQIYQMAFARTNPDCWTEGGQADTTNCDGTFATWRLLARVAAARPLLPGVYYHHTMLGTQMHCFRLCAAVARVRKDVQSTVPFNLHIRGESGATDKILRPVIVCTGLNTYLADGITLVSQACYTPTIEEFDAAPDLERKASYLKHFFLFKKTALDAVGGLDETLGDSPGIDDYDLIWTLLEHDASVGIVGDRLYNCLVGEICG